MGANLKKTTRIWGKTLFTFRKGDKYNRICKKQLTRSSADRQAVPWTGFRSAAALRRPMAYIHIFVSVTLMQEEILMNMKRLCCAAAAAAAAAAVSLCAAAQETPREALSVSAYFDTPGQLLTVSGTTGLRELTIYLSVTRKGEAVTQQALTGQTALLTVTAPLADGTFEKSFQLPDAMPGGIYEVTAVSGGKTASAVFSYINRGQAEAAVTAINSSSGAAGIQSVLSEYLDALGIDPELFEAQGGEIAAVLAGRRPSGGYVFDSMMDILNQALAAAELKQGAALTAVMERYVPGQISDPEDYKALEPAVEKELLGLLKTADFTRDPFGAVYMQNLFLAKLMAASDYIQVRDAVLRHHQAADLDLSAYEALNSTYKKDYAMKALYSADVRTVAGIKPAYEQAIAKARSLSDSGGTGGGGSGGAGRPGGGGGTGGNFAVDAETAGEINAAPRYTDMTFHWSRDMVEALSEAGVISGYEDGSFRPDETVTRAEFAKLVSQCMRLDGDAVYPFQDVEADAWFAPFVYRCASAGIVRGYDGEFRPQEEITRQDAAVMIHRMLSARGAAANGAAVFADQDQIAAYAREAVAALADAGVITGYENLFSPEDLTTRAEAAAMLCRAMAYLQ